MTCGTCKFYEKRMCRRFPPQAIVRKVDVGPISIHTEWWFPRVEEDDWCGEWEENPDG